MGTLAKKAQIGPKSSYEDPMLTFGAINYPADTLSTREFGMTGKEVSLSQKIPFPGKLSKMKHALSFEYDSEREKFNREQLELIKQVKLTYFQVFLSHKEQQILAEQRNLIRQSLISVRSRFAVGKATQAEVLGLQIEEANLIERLFEAEKNYALSLADLQRLVGDEKDLSQLKIMELSRSSIDFEKLDKEKISQKALGQNPNLKAFEAELKAAESKLSYAKWNYLPDFELEGAYMFRDRNPDDRGVGLVSARLGLSLPIWAWTKQSEEVREAKAEKDRAAAMKQEEQNQLRKQIAQIFAELHEANKKINLYEHEVLPIAKQSIVAARSAYATGKFDYSGLLSFMRSRIEAELSYFKALVNFETKIAELETLSGGPLEGVQ